MGIRAQINKKKVFDYIESTCQLSLVLVSVLSLLHVAVNFLSAFNSSKKSNKQAMRKQKLITKCVKCYYL